jgi:hypothetical protein
MKDKWLVVTDLCSLKAYRLDTSSFTRSPRLEPAFDFENAEAHGRLLDKVSDQAGRFSKGMGRNGAAAGAMSYGERHNIALEHRKRLVKQLAGQMSALLRRADVAGCYFAASKEINRQILQELEPAARAKIEKNVAADLTKTDKSELLGRFISAA